MRGLTPAERSELGNWVRGDEFLDEEARKGLAKAGRIARSVDAHGNIQWDRTDLGRLALRVCPVDDF